MELAVAVRPLRQGWTHVNATSVEDSRNGLRPVAIAHCESKGGTNWIGGACGRRKPAA